MPTCDLCGEWTDHPVNHRAAFHPGATAAPQAAEPARVNPILAARQRLQAQARAAQPAPALDPDAGAVLAGSRRWAVMLGDALTKARSLPNGCVQTIVTSPPYYGLRDYGVEGQIGLEETPEAYVQRLVELFRELRRVLRDDGTLWLNLGDSFDTGTKQLLGIPWRVAFALQADGWILRSDIIWAKPNPMPESVRDRPTKAHEYVFLLAKGPRYFYDADAVKETAITQPHAPGKKKSGAIERGNRKRADGTMEPGRVWAQDGSRNRRSVWFIAPKPFKGAHFAVFPPALVEPCVKAGSKTGDIVYDPFTGSGTTGIVALENGRRFLGTELNPKYAAEIAIPRLTAAEASPPPAPVPSESQEASA